MSTPSEDAHHLTREQALAADSAARERLSLSHLWQELIARQTRILDAFCTEERCYAILTGSGQATGAPLSGRHLEIVHGILCGSGQQFTAIDLGLAPSTVALNARQAFEAIGVSTKPSRVSPLLTAAAMAFASRGEARQAWLSTSPLTKERVVSLARPERCVRHLLPAAELAVVGGLVEGLPYTAMAQGRGTSTRTIANQISAVFRRFHVSGRNELVQWLFAHQTDDDPLPTPTLPGPPPRMSMAVPRGLSNAAGDAEELRLQRYA